MRADASFGGQFIDAFLFDHGRVHIGEQHFLLPPCLWLDHQINPLALQVFPDIPAIIGHMGQAKFSGFAARQPNRSFATPRVAECVDKGGFEPFRTGDKGGCEHRGLRQLMGAPVP